MPPKPKVGQLFVLNCETYKITEVNEENEDFIIKIQHAGMKADKKLIRSRNSSIKLSFSDDDGNYNYATITEVYQYSDLMILLIEHIKDDDNDHHGDTIKIGNIVITIEGFKHILEGNTYYRYEINGCPMGMREIWMNIIEDFSDDFTVISKSDFDKLTKIVKESKGGPYQF